MICIADELFTIWSHIKCNLKFQVKFAENFNWPRVKKRNLQCVNYSIVFLLSICTCHKKVWEQKLHLPFPFTLSHVSRSRTKGVNTFLELTKSLLHAWGISFEFWPQKICDCMAVALREIWTFFSTQAKSMALVYTSHQ